MRIGVDMDVIVPKREKGEAQRRQENNQGEQADQKAPGPSGNRSDAFFHGHPVLLPQSPGQIHPALKIALSIRLPGVIYSVFISTRQL